jgi:LAO/AO transport system kinase
MSDRKRPKGARSEPQAGEVRTGSPRASEVATGAGEVEDVCAAIRAGDRRAIARTITLLESTRGDRAERGQQILDTLVPDTGKAVRLGITGPPGVGKSTFIEALGLHLLDAGHRVAVLAVDPSSPVTGGSILGDKTRMERLAQRDEAFIRPSPSGGSLGGVAQRTRESMLVCEAAGYDVVIVETVGIGQSEVTVAGMVDFFLVLLQPGSGDELQGIKKGVLELADGLVVNKADGNGRALAERARQEHERALSLLRPLSPTWRPRVLAASATTGEGIPEVWEMVLAHREALAATGEAAARRRDQTRAWLWSLVDEGLRRSFRSHPPVAARIETLEKAVAALETTPARAARVLLDAFRSD